MIVYVGIMFSLMWSLVQGSPAMASDEVATLEAEVASLETSLPEERGGQHLRDFSPLPIEPEEFDDREVKAYYDWRNDLFFREFDMTGMGNVNYMTARRTYKVWLDEFGTPVVITVGAPLFYWLDRNGNGNFETSKGEMWSDPDEDGITGNERIYDTSHLENQPSRIPQWSAPRP